MSLDNALMPVPSVGGLVLLTGRAALVQSSCNMACEREICALG